jgi:hypothetical protein
MPVPFDTASTPVIAVHRWQTVSNNSRQRLLSGVRRQ